MGMSAQDKAQLSRLTKWANLAEEQMAIQQHAMKVLADAVYELQQKAGLTTHTDEELQEAHEQEERKQFADKFFS